MMDRSHSVWEARVNLQSRALYQLGRKHRGGPNRHDLVGITVHDQRRDVDAFEIFGEIRFAEGPDAVVRGLDRAHHSLPPPVIDNALRQPRTGTIEAVEGPGGHVPKKLRAIGEERRTESVEDVKRQTAGILRSLEHEGRYRADQNGLGDATFGPPRAGAVLANVSGHLATPRRVADMDRILQLQLFDQGEQVGCIGVHVVAVPRLARAPVATAVVGDYAEPARAEKHDLRVPIIRAERPAMTENDGLAAAPILVVDLRAVFGRDGWHG